MTMRSATDASTTLQELVDAESDLNRLTEEFREKKSPGTVIFFDLVGSTAYRRRYGAEKGALKAYQHNVHVSRAIVACGGKVVKWMGDGVMGSFTHSKCSEKHAILALKAALEALKRLADLNCKLCGDGNPDEEFHTKISISSGKFHFLNVNSFVPQDDASIGTVLDPIGSKVDLAARLNSFCNMDVILIDAESFWRGAEETIEQGSAVESETVTLPVCKPDRDTIRWRELILKQIRETVYLPKTAGFFMTDEGLELCRIGRGASEPVDGAEFHDHVKHDAGSNGDAKQFVFCSQPIPCNVRGFEDMVEVIAVTKSPHSHPVKEQVYDWYPKEIQDQEVRAEKAFRQGEDDRALEQYREILKVDPRQFHANTRVAMILRFQKDTEGALQHLMSAKQSNPLCPLVWGVAGITHLDDYLRDKGDKNVCLSRAITGLSRARLLSQQQFHGLMEQYCTALLAIAFLLRRDLDDKNQAKPLLDTLQVWPAKNSTVTIVRRIASSFLSLIEEKKRDDGTLRAMEEVVKDFGEGKLTPIEESVTKVPHDHLISNTDIQNLVAKAEYLMKIN